MDWGGMEHLSEHALFAPKGSREFTKMRAMTQLLKQHLDVVSLRTCFHLVLRVFCSGLPALSCFYAKKEFINEYIFPAVFSLACVMQAFIL